MFSLIHYILTLKEIHFLERKIHSSFVQRFGPSQKRSAHEHTIFVGYEFILILVKPLYIYM